MFNSIVLDALNIFLC